MTLVKVCILNSDDMGRMGSVQGISYWAPRLRSFGSKGKGLMYEKVFFLPPSFLLPVNKTNKMGGPKRSFYDLYSN